MLVAAFVRLHRFPDGPGVLVAIGLLVTAVAVIYSLWILVVSAAFYVVRVDNLSYLLNSILDAARWPSSVFRGTWHVLFTFVIPLALMTTYPAEALLGHLNGVHALGACAGAAVFALLGASCGGVAGEVHQRELVIHAPLTRAAVLKYARQRWRLNEPC